MQLSEPGSNILCWRGAQHVARSILATFRLMNRSIGVGHGHKSVQVAEPGRTPSARCMWNHNGVLKPLQVRAIATLMGRMNTQATTISTPCACTGEYIGPQISFQNSINLGKPQALACMGLCAQQAHPPSRHSSHAPVFDNGNTVWKGAHHQWPGVANGDVSAPGAQVNSGAQRRPRAVLRDHAVARQRPVRHAARTGTLQVSEGRFFLAYQARARRFHLFSHHWYPTALRPMLMWCAAGSGERATSQQHNVQVFGLWACC